MDKAAVSAASVPIPILMALRNNEFPARLPRLFLAPIIGESLLPRLTTQYDLKRELWRLVSHDRDGIAVMHLFQVGEEGFHPGLYVLVALAIWPTLVDVVMLDRLELVPRAPVILPAFALTQARVGDNRAHALEREMGRIHRALQVRAENDLEALVADLPQQVFGLLYAELREADIVLAREDVLLVVRGRAVDEVGYADCHRLILTGLKELLLSMRRF